MMPEKKIRPLIMPFLFLALASDAAISSEDKKPSVPDGLKLELSAAKKQFVLGEPIEITMRYTYTGKEPFGVRIVNNERDPNATQFWTFSAADKSGAAVREAPVARVPISRQRRSKLLTDGEYVQKVELNEWLCFDSPGTYRLSAESKLVGAATKDDNYPRATFPLPSTPLEIELLPFIDTDRPAQIEAARKTFDDGTHEARVTAIRKLAYLQDPRAISTLLDCLFGKFSFPNSVVHASAALRRLKDIEPVRETILKRIDADPTILDAENGDQNRRGQTAYRIDAAAQLLAEPDLRKLPPPTDPASAKQRSEAVGRQRAILLRKFSDKLREVDPPAAVKQILRATASDPSKPIDVADWRFIFSHTSALDNQAANDLYNALENFNEKEFIPQLRRLGEDTTLPGPARSGVILALHRMGDTSLRELAYLDLISPTPMLSAPAHFTIGEFNVKERSAALLKLVDNNPAGDLGSRIRNFAPAATAEELTAAFDKLYKNDDADYAAGMLTAIAIASPPAAMKQIEKLLKEEDPRSYSVYTEILGLLPRLDLPQAKLLTASLIARLDENRQLRSLFEGLCAAAKDTQPSKNRDTIPEFIRNVPPTRAVALAVFPELLDWVIGNPQSNDRTAARNVLALVSGIPKEKESSTLSDADADNLIPEWAKWWDEHSKEVDRSWLKSARK